MTGLRFVEKACRRRHTHNFTQLRVRYIGEVGDVFGRDAATERDARKDLELAQPLQTGEELILYNTIRYDSTPR